MPGCDDVYFALGLFYYELDHYQDALKYYHLSEKYFDVSFESVYNIALCHFYLEEYDEQEAKADHQFETAAVEADSLENIENDVRQLLQDRVLLGQRDSLLAATDQAELES